VTNKYKLKVERREREREEEEGFSSFLRQLRTVFVTTLCCRAASPISNSFVFGGWLLVGFSVRFENQLDQKELVLPSDVL